MPLLLPLSLVPGNLLPSTSRRLTGQWCPIYPYSTPFIGAGLITKVCRFLTDLMAALKGAQYLEELKSHDLISEPNRMLDRIYALKKRPQLTVEDVILDSPTSELLISEAKLGEIADKFSDSEISVLGKRAIAQITSKLLEGEGNSNANKPSKIEKDRGEKKSNISTASLRHNSRRERIK